MYITRREQFSSAHKLINHQLTEEGNRKIFGKCLDLHGHNYELFVTVTGSINKTTGFIIDLKDLKKILIEKVINKLDHKYINDVDFMKNKITSTENLCLHIWKEIEKPIKVLGGNLYKIKIKETENHCFEYFGEKKN